VELDSVNRVSKVTLFPCAGDSMINRLISNDVMELVQKSLDAAALQHKVIANNLANVDTPGFKRSEVVFGESLKKAIQERETGPNQLELARTDSQHIEIHPGLRAEEVTPQVVRQQETTLRNDQNNVDIDVEMAKLAQNTVVYQTLAQLTQSQFSQLKSAIREGK
jgi:flagellar basal-body rod protein FlgB